MKILQRLLPVALLFGGFVGGLHDVTAKPPATLTGTIVGVSDGDTFTAKCCMGGSCRLMKIRLRAADCPETKHYRFEVDQPGGREALDYVVKNYLGKGVTISVVGDSYGRSVADVRAGETDLARDLIAHGHAMLDTRYSKSPELKAAQDEAQREKRGLWAADSAPLPPWEWRKLTRQQQIDRRKAK